MRENELGLEGLGNPQEALTMPFSFENLGEQTRRFMLEGVERDIGANSLYMSPR